MVIADNFAPLVNNAFELSDPYHSGLYWWFIMTLFAFQIFCDFSGYSDIAIGLAKWMGYQFPNNFLHPYISSNMREFWSRWHISLSNWFRDYLYIPLGGGKAGKWAGIRNMCITMLVSGLWHGAAWNFIIWGGLHALYLSLERITLWPEKLKKISFGLTLSTLVVLLQVWIAWVFFRATSFSQATKIIEILFTLPGELESELDHIMTLPNIQLVLTTLVFAIGVEIWKFLEKNGQLENIKSKIPQISALRPSAEILIVTLALLLAIFFRGPGNTFIYFQF